MRNITELFLATVKLHGDALALVSGNVRLTWSELAHQVQMRCHKLCAMGVSRGDVVSIVLRHNHELVISILAVSACDAQFVVHNTKLTGAEKIRQIKEAASALVISSPSISDNCNVLNSLGDVPVLAVADEERSEDSVLLQEAGSATLDWPVRRSIPADVSNIFFTSGSTGSAKGVVVPHRTLLDGARIVSEYLNIQETDVILSILPFSFDYGLNQLLLSLQTGARLVMLEYVLPSQLIHVIRDERVTVLAGVPSMWPKVCDAIEQSFGDSGMNDSLRLITTAGGPHPLPLLERVGLAFPDTQIMIMYGLTESFRSTYLDPSETFRRIGSIGKPVAEVEILVLDESGQECAPGEPGELYHRGAFINYGYLNDSESTERKYIAVHTVGKGCRPEVVVRSGDLVSRDAEGFIYFHGRIDSQIKAFGYRVSPSEVEDAAMSIAGVRQAAAFPAVDLDYGEVVGLAYTLKAGHALSVNEVLDQLRSRLASFAVPRKLVELDEMPLTVTGKIDYSLLKSTMVKD